MRDLKGKILKFYYVEHFSAKEISKRVSTSSSYISQVIKSDTRYKDEKELRKQINSSKRKIAQKNQKRKIREREKFDDNYSFVKAQHNQAVMEMSKGRKLSNENYRKWNYSAYKYNPSKNRYEFDSKLGRSYDVPKYVKGG